MIRTRNGVLWAAILLTTALAASPSAAQIDAQLEALDAVLPQLYGGEPVTLATCLEVGEVASLNLAGQREDLGVAETNQTAAILQWLPTLGLSGRWTKGEQTQIDYTDPQTFLTSNRTDGFRNDSQSLSADWTIFNGFDRIYEKKEADASLRSTGATLEYQRRVVRESISDAYYDLQRAYARVRVAEDAEQLALAELERVETYRDLGISTRSDVLQQKVRHQQTKLDVVREKTGERRAFILLAYAMNIPGAAAFRVSEELPVVDRIEVRTLEDLLEQAGENRLDLVAAEYSVSASEASLGRARSAYYPRFTLFGSASRSFNDLPPEFRFGSETSYTWSFGFQGSWDLFDGWRREQRNRQAVATKRKAEYQLRQTRLEVELQVVNIYSNLIDAVESYEVSSFTVEQSEEDLRLAEERFRVGAGTQLDVINAQVNLATARRDLVDAQVNYAKFLNQMRRAIGGDVVAMH